MKKSIILVLLTMFFILGCSTKKEELNFHPIVVEEKKEEIIINENIVDGMQRVGFNQIDGFFEDDLDYALEVFKKDCEKSKRFDIFKNVCQKAKYEKDGRKFFIINFEAYKLYDNQYRDEGIITGYYEPLLNGSLQKSEKYKYPVYKTPKNLILSESRYLRNYKKRGKIVKGKIMPYDTREEIENNPHNPNLVPIAYVDDKFDLFFLQIQGSGKIKLEDGKILNVGYASQNGHPYFSIGTHMIEKEYLTKDEMSVQGMKEFFNRNPHLMDEIFNLNKSYVFFRISDTSATGALNTVLTPKRNIAVDRRYIELGMPVFLSTKNPVTQEPLNQLMVAADVGGAIKGEIRADFFWGFGEEAFNYAGRMKEKGKIYILKPKH